MRKTEQAARRFMSYRGKIIWYGWDESGKLYYMIKEPGGGEKRYRDCLGAMEEIEQSERR